MCNNGSNQREEFIDNWAGYIERIEDLQAKHRELKKETPLTLPSLLYRGQPSSGMELHTTLERTGRRDLNVTAYFRLVSRIKCKIESIIGTNWPIISEIEYANQWQRPEIPFSEFPGYEYFAYLRHHGFPSPLLDWSRSPFVATLFALAPTPQKTVEFASVFVYLGSKRGMRVGNLGESAIQTLGPYVKTTQRHYLQQSEYTVCLSGEGCGRQYSSHEAVFKRNDNEQDLLWKLNIPITHRLDFLHHLYQMNVAPYSLFQTEDKLMEYLWLAEEMSGDFLGQGNAKK